MLSWYIFFKISFFSVLVISCVLVFIYLLRYDWLWKILKRLFYLVLILIFLLFLLFLLDIPVLHVVRFWISNLSVL